MLEGDADYTIRARVLREVAAEWDAEYERLTEIHGAYGETKLRAAYRLGSILLAQRAEEEED